MIKDAGTDRFTVPKLLQEFEADQVENFTRIFQEHAVIAAHHVGQVAFLEQYLEQRHWSGALDDALATQLPWPDARLEEMRRTARQVPEHLQGLARAQAIRQSTPFPTTRALATLARVALEDWGAGEEAAQCLHLEDEAIRAEAALALSHWRVIYGPGMPVNRREILEALHACPLREAAAERLTLLGEPPAMPLPADDFATALVNGDIDRLTAGAREGDPLMRFAAAQRLIELDTLASVGDVLRSSTPEKQLELLRQLERRKKPVPELKEALFETAASSQERQVVRTACSVLCIGCDPADTLQIARAGRGDTGVYQSLFQRAALPPEALEKLGEFLIAESSFRADQWGIRETAKAGRMPVAFVPRHWQGADKATRVELCRYAELQLGESGDDDLHRFLTLVALTPSNVQVQSEAWSCLYRWYDSLGFPRRRPLKFGPEAIGFFCGTPAAFLTCFARFLENGEILRETLQRDRIAELLRYPDPNVLALLEQAPAETLRLADAVAGAMRDQEIDFIIRLACTDFLGFLGWAGVFRDAVTALLKTFAGTDLDLQSARALAQTAR
ncbi:MAG TPA: hypothetical protein VGH38_08880 [Bryobacteraceae bacterium]